MALTLQQIRDKVDAALAPLATAIQSRQAIWIGTHSTYWQGQKTFSSIPVDGVDTNTDGSVKPSGVGDVSWATFGITLPATLGGTIGVTSHKGPLGVGYTMWAMATFNNRTFYRSLGVGFYGVTQAWIEVFNT